jgi:hypothetical protein
MFSAAHPEITGENMPSYLNHKLWWFVSKVVGITIQPKFYSEQNDACIIDLHSCSTMSHVPCLHVYRVLLQHNLRELGFSV